jgi:hypothetical protein
MKIAGWEVPQQLIDAAERRMRASKFGVADIRRMATDSSMLPSNGTANWRYIRDEIGTRLIAYFKRAGKIQSVPGSRKWEWVKSKADARATDSVEYADDWAIAERAFPGETRRG